FFFFSSRRRHTRFSRDWSSDVCSSDLPSRPSSGAAGPSGTWLLVHPGAGEPGEPGGPEHGAVREALEASGAKTVSVGVPADADRASLAEMLGSAISGPEIGRAAGRGRCGL